MTVRALGGPSLTRIELPAAAAQRPSAPGPRLRSVAEEQRTAALLGTAPRAAPDLGILVLLRHGQSQWNLENRFTGSVDVPLTAQGEREARRAGEALRGIRFDSAYSSELGRAKQTLDIVLEALGQKDVAVEASASLNERHYGVLQGVRKDAVGRRWRSWSARPPGGESLADTLGRALPFFEERVLADLRAGKNVLVVSHANTLRALIAHLEGFGDRELEALSVPTGAPMLYALGQRATAAAA